MSAYGPPAGGPPDPPDYGGTPPVTPGPPDPGYGETPPPDRRRRPNLWQLLALLFALLALVLLIFLLLDREDGPDTGPASSSGPYASTVTQSVPYTVTSTVTVTEGTTVTTTIPVKQPPVTVIRTKTVTTRGPDLGGGSTAGGTDVPLLLAGFGLLLMALLPLGWAARRTLSRFRGARSF